MAWTGPVVPVVSGLAAACLVVGIIWGYFFTPDDVRMGATVKIIYIHVPSAMMAINVWVMMLVASLIKRSISDAFRPGTKADFSNSVVMKGLSAGASETKLCILSIVALRINVGG